MIFDLLKVGRGEDTAAHYVVTCDFAALERLSHAAAFTACQSNIFGEVRDSVELALAVDDVIARGKKELQAEN